MSDPRFLRRPPQPGEAPPFPETWLGVVVSVKDPDGRGRVQVRLFGVDGVEGQDAAVWARVAMSVAGSHRGTFLLPDVDDEVLVTFVGGDPSRPVVMGSLYNGANPPTETLGKRGGVDRWSFTSRDGTHVIVKEEKEGEATVRVELPANGPYAELTQAAGGKLELKTSAGTVKIDSAGITLETSSKVSVTASTVEVSAGSVTVDAAMARFSGVVQCNTLLANTVSGATYTPGAGNVW